MKTRVIFSMIIFLSTPLCLTARNVTLEEALRLSIVNNPNLKSVSLNVAASKERSDVQRSAYFPSLNAAAITESGYPGGDSFLGVNSDIGAKNRIGSGGALTLKQNIWDFNRTVHQVESAKAAEELKSSEFNIVKAETYQTVLHSYLECSNVLGQLEVWGFVAKESSLIEKEIRKMVKTGQRSLIEEYLAAEAEREAETSLLEDAEKKKALEKRLSILLNTPEENYSCLPVDTHESGVQKFSTEKTENPLLEKGKNEVKLAQASLLAQKSKYNPELLALANGGYFKNGGLSYPWNYSIALGLQITLFDGLKTSSEIAEARILSEKAQTDLNSTQEKINLMNNRFDEVVHSDLARLGALEKESKLAMDAFKLAKDRYFSFQGKMVDLRDALQNLTRIRLAINNTQSEYVEALGSQKLFEGAQP